MVIGIRQGRQREKVDKEVEIRKIQIQKEKSDPSKSI